MAHRCRQGTRLRQALLGLSAWSLLGLLPGCGGGGSGSGAQADPAISTSALGGSLVYMTGSQLRHLDLATGEQGSTPTDPSTSFNKLGYGAGQFTLMLNPPLSAFGQFTTVWQRWTAPGGFERTAGLAYPLQARLHGGSTISSSVQPSPDGMHVSYGSTEFERLGATARNYLYVVEAGTGKALTLEGYADAVWVDAASLVGVKPDGLFLVRLQPDGLQEARIGPPGLANAGTAPSSPSLSPDGRSVAFVQDGAVWRIGIDGQGLTPLTVARATPPAWPTWSPDGQRLAVVEMACRSSTGFDFPPVHWISATRAQQVLEDAPVMKDRHGAPACSCAPVYWLSA